MSWKDTFYLACTVRLYHLWQFVNNLFRYYLWHPTFFIADTLVLAQYFFKSPHKIIFEYDETHHNHQIGPYGETDFRVMEKLLKGFSIDPTDSIADLGAGRGRLGFFLRIVRGQRNVLALEYCPLMVQRAERVRRWLHVRDLSFIQGDWMQTPLDDIDVVYLYGFVIEAEASKKLVRRLSLLKEGTRIITISTWLGESMPGSFRLEKKLPVHFEWGETEAFLQTVTKN